MADIDCTDHIDQACVLPPTGICSAGWCDECDFYKENRLLEAIREAGVEVKMGIVIEGG